MRPLAIVSFALVCALPRTVSAQAASAEVVATVAQDLVIASEGETSFGSINNFAHTEKINPNDPDEDKQQTTALFTATASAPMSFSCPTSVMLSGPGADMTFTPELVAAGFAQGQSVGGVKSCPSFSDLQTSLWIWLGGSLEVAASQAPGNYSGTFTLTAAYQ